MTMQDIHVLDTNIV